MDKHYDSEKKKRLANRISKVKNKKHLVHIYEIISKNNVNITENNNGMYMYFQDLSNSTYKELDIYLKSIRKNTESNNETLSTEKKEYTPYTQDEFPDQEYLGAKLKYSNKEKNIVKKKLFNQHMSNNKNVTYCSFNLTTISDSETDKKNST